MITLFTGMPGAGKTAAMVQLLSSMSGNRPVYVHYDATAKRDSEQVLLHESLKIPHHACNANDWPTELPHGAILVIDEVQDIWRPRGPGSKVPVAVAALETHRHTGVDIFLTTQSPRLLDLNVRGLVGRHIHIRDTGILGRYWYEWPECNDAMAWKTCVNKRRYKLPKKAFGLYKSSSLHTPAVRGVPVSLYVAAFSLLMLFGLIYAVYKITQRPALRPPIASSAAMSQPGDVVGLAGGSGGVQVASHRVGPIDDRVDWVPRVSTRPESAPAYDHLRVIRTMPVVQAGVCVGNTCRCLTQQGTDAGLSNAECARFVSNPPFDPYRASPVVGEPLNDSSKPRQSALASTPLPGVAAALPSPL